MNEPFSEELLSAYVDGELSAQERAAVDRWIEHSPEARQKLEDFRRLSRLFGDLPRTEVPREFPTEVLHLAERRMLLPEARTVRGRIRIRGWMLALAAPTVAAALLLAILKISNRDDVAGDRAVRLADGTKAPAHGLDVAQKSNTVSRPGIVGETADGQRQPSDSLVAQREPRSARRSIAGGTEAASPPSGILGEAGGKSSTAGSGLAKSKPAETAPAGPPAEDLETDPQLQAINEVVQEIRDSGTTDKLLSVVTVYVVDRAEGLVLLQEAFAANNILIESPEAADGKAADGAKSTGNASHDGLYVEAQADEVIAGFKTYLSRAHQGARLSVERSIELADLDPESQKQLSLGENAQASAELSRGDEGAKKGSKDLPEEAKSAGSRTASPKGAAVPSSKADAAQAGQDNKSPEGGAQKKKSSSMATARSNRRPGLDRGTVEKSARAALPSAKDSGEKVTDGLPEAVQTTSNNRQIAVPVPLAIQNRPRSTGSVKSQDGTNLAGGQKQEAPLAARQAKSRDEKPLVQDDNPEESPPALVRMLIVIEREPQTPDVPADKKGPSGGAS